MERANAIEELTFEFAFASHSVASAHQETFVQHAQQLGPQVIDVVLDEFATLDEVLIDRIDLDLGPVDPGGHDFAEQLQRQLRAALQDALAQRGARADVHRESADAGRVSGKVLFGDVRQSELDAVWQLLTMGFLPWRYSHAAPRAIDSLVDRVLVSDARQIAERIAALHDPAPILARLERQWTASQRERLASFGVRASFGRERMQSLRLAQVPGMGAPPEGSSHAFPANPAADSFVDPDSAATSHFWATLGRAQREGAGQKEIAAARAALAELLRLRPGLAVVVEALIPTILEPALFEAAAGEFVRSKEDHASGLFAEAFEFAQRVIENRRRVDSVHPDLSWKGEWLSGNPGAAAIEEIYALDHETSREFLLQLATDQAWLERAAQSQVADFWQAILAVMFGEGAQSNLLLATAISLSALPQVSANTANGSDLVRLELLQVLFEGGEAASRSPDTLSKLVIRVAKRTGLAESLLARALIESAPGIIRHSLAADLGKLTGLVASEPTRLSDRSADRITERQFERLLSAGRWPAELGPESSIFSPDWIGGRLRHLGTQARWRQAFASELDPNRAAILLGLWLPATVTGALARLFSKSEVWQTGKAAVPSQHQLYEVMLTALQRTHDGAVSPSGFIETAVLLMAQARDLDPFALAIEVLRELSNDPATTTLHRELSLRWRGAASSLEPEKQKSLRRARSVDPAKQGKLHGASGADRTLQTPLRRSDKARSLAPASSGPAALSHLAAQERRALYERLAPGRAAYVQGMFDRLAAAWAAQGYAVVSVPADEELLQALLFGRDPALDPASLASAWAVPRLQTLDRHERDRAVSVLANAVGASETLAQRRSGNGQSPGAEAADYIPEGPLLPEWYSALPSSLTPQFRQRIAQLLVPPHAGIGRLSGLDPAQQRQLLIRIEPDSAPVLTIVDLLDNYWREASLEDSELDRGERSIRLVLRILFEQRLGFDAFVVTHEWLKVKLGALGTAANPEALWRLVQPGRTPTPPGYEMLRQVALPRALRLAGIARPETRIPEAGPVWPGLVATSPVMPIMVENAGLVLLAPYFQPLLARLELTSDDSFVSIAAAERAVHVLELLIDGIGETLDPGLALNKLICGIDLLQPVGRDFLATEEERELAQSLLDAVIQNWGKLGSTSVEGLREAFLQRGGSLTREDECWQLRVEERAIDVLIDGIPWGFHTIKLPWMEGVLHVDWR